MSGDAGDSYAGREQTKVKHAILEGYLERFAHIIGSWADVITYIDGFSGPWNVHSKEDLADSSFNLALRQLRKARKTHKDRGRTIQIRCFFVEREKKPYKQLQAFAESVTDAEIKTKNAEFEGSIDDACAFARPKGGTSFSFVFIDPTGWTGFAMDRIAPLLLLDHAEVLINFMTGHILRFAEHPDPGIATSFDRLFGSINYRDRIRNLSGQDREDELVLCYMDAVKKTGKFSHVCSAVVLHPERDRTHFHLIYATRNQTGVEVFKEAEKAAMAVMEEARAEAQQQKRESKTGQMDLFSGEELHDPAHYDELRDRYLKKAKTEAQDLIESERRVKFGIVWATALSWPLVWRSDVMEWINEWTEAGRIKLEGLSPRERVPKWKKDHWVVWCGGQ